MTITTITTQLLDNFKLEVVPKTINRSYEEIVSESSFQLTEMNSLFIRYNTTLKDKGLITDAQSFELGKAWYIANHIPNNDNARKMKVS